MPLAKSAKKRREDQAVPPTKYTAVTAQPVLAIGVAHSVPPIFVSPARFETSAPHRDHRLPSRFPPPNPESRRVNSHFAGSRRG